jgi:hypothetical protein
MAGLFSFFTLGALLLLSAEHSSAQLAAALTAEEVNYTKA